MTAHALTLVRDEKRGTGVEGRLFLDGLYVGPTLERLAVAIPPGVWPVYAHQSPKFGRLTIWISCGRGWTLIHAGGIPEHSEGCVLLGANDLDGAAVSGGAPIVTWLEKRVLGSLAAGEAWTCTVTEIAGDVADGAVV